ncbi:MAG TPA: ribokinase [Gemmataceae bacterium]|nr:ribokinase [Gemmataceae bacterium]
MASPPRICVVGSANVDLTFRTPRLPTPGETLAGHAFHLGMGGKGANQAVAAARLGAKVALIARVGNDTFGQEAIRRYRAEGLDATFVRQDAQCPTGTAAIVVDDAAENCIIVVAGANASLSQEDVRDASTVIQNADVLLCQLETPLEATLEAFRLAHAAGVLTVLTPAPVMSLPDSLLQLCDLCVPNRTELELLVGRKVDSPGDAQFAASMLRERGVKTLVVTMGSRGALLLDAEGATHVSAVEVAAVDSTGAGDAFTAGLAVWLAEGFSLREAAQQASIVGALTATRLGTQAAFPSLAEVREWMGSG